ncbi:hypothetical protein WAI453_005461 [Rhynchosporium graminicola]
MPQSFKPPLRSIRQSAHNDILDESLRLNLAERKKYGEWDDLWPEWEIVIAIKSIYEWALRMALKHCTASAGTNINLTGEEILYSRQ